MTLKVRLATIMGLLLLGALAIQFVLASRDQADLARRISDLSDEMNRSSREISLLAHGARPRRDVDRLFRRSDGRGLSISRRTFGLQGEGDVLIETVVSDTMYARAAAGYSDSLVVRMMEVETDTTFRFVGKLDQPPAALAFENDSTRHAWFHSFAARDSFTYETLIPELRSRLGSSSRHDIQIMFPFPSEATDSLTFVEMRYPTDTLTEALGRARRRSLFWLSSLLGVGLVGATVLAGQFTRPIRALEQSFRRVESGDLSVNVTPERNDEIGRLTASFNHMVGRLRETQSMERRLADAEREAAMGRLAAGVAHEVRNPLNAIQLNLQQMRDKAAPVDGTPERRDFDRYAATVTSEVARLESVVGAFLDLSRAEAVQAKPLDAADSVRAAVDLFRADATSRGVTLNVDGDDTAPVDGDPTRLPMVWNNLLANALDATPSGGRIDVTIGGDETTVEIAFRDTGVGLEPDALQRMWDPFFSGRDDGTGLGLSIVRSVTERHGGTVTATSAPGDGTTMTVRLPRRGGVA